MGLRPAEARRRFPSVITFAELEDFVDLPLGNYSSGMQVRLAFSTSFQVGAELLLFDEVLAVGDEVFKDKCMATFERLIERGHTIVYVSHALDTVRKFSDRVLLLDHGPGGGPRGAGDGARALRGAEPRLRARARGGRGAARREPRERTSWSFPTTRSSAPGGRRRGCGASRT